jgi:putative ABC transport system permease protein
MLRATFKSLLSRKLRLFLSGAAVVLGVLFVSGALVLTDTLGRSFDNLFTGIFAYTDIQASQKAEVRGLTGAPTQPNLPAADVARVEAVPGVTKATGQVFTDGARVIGKNGKVLASAGGPRFGANWLGENELIKLREGRGPTADNEVAISANVAKRGHFAIGDQIGVLTALPKQTFTVVGIFGYTGGRDSLAGETTVAFTERVAQTSMLREPDVFNAIDIKVDDGASLTEVRDRIAAVLGPTYQVQTGKELADASAEGIGQALSFFSYLLLGFAGVALFVGVFLILNTFSIVVAQRTQELALFRAMGASRRQVIGSVLVEAVVVGVLASVLGLGIGILVGAGLAAAAGSFLSDGALQLAGLAVPPSAVIAAFAVGVGVTVLAALMPAVRASRIPPVAALRESATPDRPLTRMTIGGAAVLAVGGTALGLGLTGNLGEANLWGVLTGLLLCFVGVAMLTPIISRPVVSALGRLVGRAAAARLGRRNSSRNPRRTAITAGALMVSIALVTGVSVIFASIQESTVKAVDTGLDAQLVVAADPLSGGIGAIDPAAIAKMRQLSGVDAVASTYADVVKVDGVEEFVGGTDDFASATEVFKLKTISGNTSSPTAGSFVVDDKSAADRTLTIGSTVTIQMARSGTKTYTVAGIYERTALVAGFFFGPDDVRAGFQSSAPLQAFVKVSPGADVAAVQAQVDDLIKDSPEVTSSTVDDYVASQAQIFTFILIFVQVLLGLAMIIAVLGIINTLALSMIERTRELGLLRAVGMRRPQVMWMVTVESVVISVFGALLGIAVGVGLGTAVFQALREQGFTDLAFPWPLMVVYVVASVGVGLVAALFPAIRAARLDVLRAIAYE